MQYNDAFSSLFHQFQNYFHLIIVVIDLGEADVIIVIDEAIKDHLLFVVVAAGGERRIGVESLAAGFEKLLCF